MPKGRPRSNSIPRFNIDTFMLSNGKFVDFMLELSIDEKTAYLTLCRWFNYVAINAGVTGQINLQNTRRIAHELWWTGDEKALINALLTCGFVDDSGNVKNWHQNQPLAEDILSKRNAPASPTKTEQRELGGIKKRPIRFLGDNRNLKSESKPESKPSPETDLPPTPFTQNPDPDERPVGQSAGREGDELTPLCHQFAREWNQVACAENIALKPITEPISSRRLKLLRGHLAREPIRSAWQSGDLWAAMREQQRFLGGGGGRGWLLTFDALVERRDLLDKIIERKFPDHNGHGTKGSNPWD